MSLLFDSGASSGDGDWVIGRGELDLFLRSNLIVLDKIIPFPLLLEQLISR